MDLYSILNKLKEKSNPSYLAGMQRFGVNTSKALGIKIPELRKLARTIKKEHSLALQLWETDIHEARILASMIDDPEQVTQQQINSWVKDFNSWDLCDQVCGNLFDKTKFAVSCAKKFSKRKEEFVKRAGFVLMAESAVHNKNITDDTFMEFLPFIEQEAWDDRNFVKKAVNWALRQIGKRNKLLHKKAIETAKRISEQNYPSAKWIAKDALKELRNSKNKDQNNFQYRNPKRI